jgi:hypothetical protein
VCFSGLHARRRNRPDTGLDINLGCHRSDNLVDPAARQSLQPERITFRSDRQHRTDEAAQFGPVAWDVGVRLWSGTETTVHGFVSVSGSQRLAPRSTLREPRSPMFHMAEQQAFRWAASTGVPRSIRGRNAALACSAPKEATGIKPKERPQMLLQQPRVDTQAARLLGAGHIVHKIEINELANRQAGFLP